jgi:hypothetical protein
VVQSDGEHQSNSDVDPLGQWLTGAKPWIVALSAAAFEALDTETRGALHAQVTAEKLVSAALQAREWQFGNPGPVQVIAEAFAGIFNTFTALADEYVVVAEFTSDDDPPDLDGRLERAVLALYEVEHAVEHGEEFFRKSYNNEQEEQ